MTATPSGVSSDRDAGDEAVEVGDVRQHVVGVDHVGALALRARSARGERLAEELDDRVGCRFASATCGDVARRLDAEHRHAGLLVVLQQVAVVAGDLDHQARPAPRPRSSTTRSTMLRACAQHRVGERREVDVVAEQLLGRHGLGDLHQRAGPAEHEVERDSVGSGSPQSAGSTSAFASGVAPSDRITGPQSAAARRGSGTCASCGVPRKLAVPGDRPRRALRRA